MEETTSHTKLLIALALTLSTLLSAPSLAYSNGGYSADPSNPDYGTHDWIAQHALDWLPDNEKRYISDNLDDYLYGTELPDNGAAPDGIGDFFNHHVYFHSTGDLQDDISASRAQEEYDEVIDRLLSGEDALAAKQAGIMSHYVVDLAVFGHVMGSSTDWGSEAHHSDYENYVRDRTTGYVSSEFDPYLVFDGDLVELDAYDGALDVAFVTTFGDGGDVRSCVWMDGNYDWSDGVFRDGAGASLNLAVNVLADVLHGIAVVGVEEEVNPPVVKGSVFGRVVDEDGGPLEGALVRLKDVDNGDVVDTEITGLDGGFGFSEVTLGDYTVLVSMEGYVGYETVTYSVSEGEPAMNVEDIVLEGSPQVEIGGSQDWTWIWVGLLAGMVGVLVVLLIVKRRRRSSEKKLSP